MWGGGTFPEVEEVLIGGSRFHGVRLGIRAAQLKMRERRDGLIQGNARMVDQLFEFHRSCCPIVCRKIRLPRTQSRKIARDMFVNLKAQRLSDSHSGGLEKNEEHLLSACNRFHHRTSER